MHIITPAKVTPAKVTPANVTPTKVIPANATQPACKMPKPATVVGCKATHDDIAQRAYQIYVKKGCASGQCEQNWLQAEQELRSQGPATRPAK